MTLEVDIRPAGFADARVGAHLAHISMGRLADFLLGLDLKEPTRAREVLEGLFMRKNNRFSYQFACVAEISDQVAGGHVVGLLLSYPGEILMRLAFPMAGHLLSIYGLPRMFRFLQHALPLAGIEEAKRDEYFIHIVAVLPEFQGRGVGTRLLSYAEDMARAGGLNKCSLNVEIGNTRARGLYERLGYRVAKTVRVRRLSQCTGCEGFHRMVKILA